MFFPSPYVANPTVSSLAAEGRVRDLISGNLMILSQVFESGYAWDAGEVQRGMRLGLRAVGLENRPTCAAHLDIGRGCKSLFWTLHVSEPARPGDPSVGWRWNLVRFLGCRMRAPCAHVFPETLRRKPYSLQPPALRAKPALGQSFYVLAIYLPHLFSEFLIAWHREVRLPVNGSCLFSHIVMGWAPSSRFAASPRSQRVAAHDAFTLLKASRCGGAEATR